MSKLKYKKAFFITGALIVAVIFLVIVFISPITKHLIEKYDEKYSGRKITMSWAYVNPFTGYVHFRDLKIYESKSDSIFFSAKGLSANFEMYKLLSKTYEISELVVDDPKGVIIQHEKQLNFDDLIDLFNSPEKKSNKPPVHLSILRIKINNGEFYYRENVTPVNYYIKKVNCESSGFYWNKDTIAGNFSLVAGKSGSDLKANFTINYKTLAYEFAAIATKFDLEIIDQYLKNLVNYGTFRANIDADLKATGYFNDKENITIKGLVSVNDMHFGKDSTEDYTSFKQLVLDINELSPKYHKYEFDSLRLTSPYFKYERYDNLDNLQTMFGKMGTNITAANADPEKFNLVIELARYVKVLSKNFFKSVYKINKLAIIDADLKFNDYSLNEKFSFGTNSLYIQADSINKNQKRVEVFLKSTLHPYGNLAINLSINPNDSSDFDLNCHLQKIPATLFNPYLVTYTSFPLDRGSLEFKADWHVRNGNIQSTNHLLIMDPHLSTRIKKKDMKRVSMPLLMALIRERGNVIDYEIPITGNLNDPKFHLQDAIIDLLGNIFIKPPTTGYGVRVSNTENEIEKLLSLKWEMRSALLGSDQENFIQKIAKFLKDNHDASLSIYPVTYLEKEKEQILFFEAKKKYFLRNHNNLSLNEGDSIAIDKISIKDSLFVKFLDKNIDNKMMFTIQEKCRAFIDPNILIGKLNQLLRHRENTFRSYFKANNTDSQIHIHLNENGIPYNGFSYYKIKYKGEIPESLLSAFISMNEMNGEIPRKKYLKERKQNYHLSEQSKK